MLLIFFFIFNSFSIQGQSSVFSQKSAIDFDSIIKADAFSENHARKFGELVISRLWRTNETCNTFSSELLRKVSKNDKYQGLNLIKFFFQ